MRCDDAYGTQSFAFSKISLTVSIILISTSVKNELLKFISKSKKNYLSRCQQLEARKEKNTLQERTEYVSEELVSQVLVESEVSEVNQDLIIGGPLSAKSPRIENSALESLRASLKDEITSEIKKIYL